MKSKHLAGWMRKAWVIGGVVLIVLALMVVGLHFLPLKDYSISKSATAIIQPAVQNQQKIIKEISDTYQKGKYTFENPLVLQNPFDTAPLTALIIFDTSNPVQISIHIPGKTDLTAVDYTFDGLLTHHEIPIYGLYANQVNHMTLTAKDQKGDLTQKVIDLQTEPVPTYLQPIQIISSIPDSYSPGMNFTFLDFKEIFDANGDIRWYSTRLTSQAYTPLKNGHFLLTYPLTNDIGHVVMEEDLLGKIYTIYDVPNGVRHDMAEMPNGNILVTTQQTDSYTIFDVINEIDAKSGEIVHSIDFKNYLDTSRPNELYQPSSDWLHINSVAYDTGDNAIVISCRTQSAVVKFTYPSMQIKWILGTHDNWPAEYQKYLLTPVGDNFEWMWSQHDASILSDEVIDGDKITNILLFDNGLYRSFDAAKALPAAQSYSRLVLYQIDETKMTVKQLWEYGKDRGLDLFSISRGSAYLLSNGDYLGNWAEIVKDVVEQSASGTNSTASAYSEVIEVNPSSNQVVFEAKIADTDYRVFRAGMYDNYSAADSAFTLPLNNTTQMTLRQRIITFLQPAKKWVGSLDANLRMTIKHDLQKNGIWYQISQWKVKLLGR